MQLPQKWQRKTNMKVKPMPKIKIKEPTPSAADRLYAKHQAIRKAKGLPDPSVYKKKLDDMKKEEVEQLDELSPATKASYKSKALAQVKEMKPWTKKGEYKDLAKNAIAKREKGIAKVSEEVEQLDEIGNTPAGRKALGNYINRSHESGDAARIMTAYDKDNFAKHAKTVAKRSSGIAKAVTRLTKEQLEKKGRFVSGPVKQPFKSNTVVTPIKEGFRIGGMSNGGRGNVHQYDRNPPAKDGSELENIPFNAKTEKQKKIQNALNDLGNKMKETHPKLKEGFADKIKIRKKGTNITKEISSDSYSVFKHHGFRKEEVEKPTGDLKSACWKGYTAVGMKMKNGRKVPNCVPVKEEAEEPSMAARTLSRKAQIVKAAAKSKKAAKEEASDKFQKDPELSSDIQKT